MRLFSALLAVVLSAAPALAGDWVAKPFTLRTPEGRSVSLADYRGKVVVVEFFASWCEVCAASVPDMNALAKRYGDKLAVLAVATAEDDPHGLEAFVDEHAPAYTILVDDTDRVARAYDVIAFPTFFVVDGDGLVQAYRRGPVEWENKKVARFMEGLVYGNAATAAAETTAPTNPPFPDGITTVSR